MKKTIILNIAVIALSFGLVLGVSAKNYGLTTAAESADYSVDTSANVYSMTQIVISGILALIGFVFFGYTLYSGLRWLTAQGNQQHIDKAKKTLISSVIGLAIIAAAYGLTNFVFEQLNK